MEMIPHTTYMTREIWHIIITMRLLTIYYIDHYSTAAIHIAE